MYNRTSLLRFHPGAADEALGILRDDLLPHARQEAGFRGVLVLRAEGERGIVITLWETEADLRASQAPASLAPRVKRLGELIAESHQETYEVVLSHLPSSA
jgi:heme-degrading monooxygenase HmoA